MPEGEIDLELAELLGVAVDLAHRAGALVRDGRDRADRDPADLAVSTKSTPTDPVTEIDRAAELFLVEELRSLRPGDGVLGEEGAERAGSTGIRWLIDPIDGTVNFVYGLPVYAVSVAAERGGVTLAGCVHNPASGESFLAVRGGGSWLGSRPLTANGRATSLDQAVVGTGFGYDASRRGRQGRVLAGVLPRVANVRRLGSAALDLCYVAAGRLDGYYEQGLSRWDSAAGALVATEAGAVVSGLRGQPAGPKITIAASPRIADDLVQLLAELGADDV